MLRASASGAIDLGLIPSRVKPMTSKLVFTAFPLDAQHQKDSVENKQASLLVVPWKNALCEIPLLLFSRDRRHRIQFGFR